MSVSLSVTVWLIRKSFVENTSTGTGSYSVRIVAVLQALSLRHSTVAGRLTVRPNQTLHNRTATVSVHTYLASPLANL